MTSAKRPVAIVTGAARGIGLGIAQALARSGHDIAITDLGEMSDDDPVLKGLREFGADAAYFPADLRDVHGHAATVEAIAARFGAVSCLVNNAGMASVVRGDFLELTPNNFDAIMATNLRGTLFFTQAVLRRMLADRDAAHPRSIITITSVSSALSSPERLDYCISKAGLSTLMQGLALRLAGDGIGVFEVRPGIIRTGMTSGVSAKYDALIEGGLVPMKRWGEPADIGAICASLASGSFAFATGSVIDADGGLSIGRL